MRDSIKTASISDNLSWTTATTGTVHCIPISTSTATITTTKINDLLQEAANCINSFTNEEMTFTVKVPEFHPEWNCKPDNLMFFDSSIMQSNVEPVIVNINIIVPNKVVEVTIFDGKVHTYKQICQEYDIFDLNFALALAWAKYKDGFTTNYHLTVEGLEKTANQYLCYYKETQKEFNRAIKAYNKWFKEETRKEVEEEERQAIIERRRAKNKKRKEKMKARKREEEINTIAEAIKRSKENK